MVNAATCLFSLFIGWCNVFRASFLNQIKSNYRGEWGNLSHPPQLNQKAGEKMFMSSIVWSYSKGLLHHVALKYTLW